MGTSCCIAQKRRICPFSGADFVARWETFSMIKAFFANFVFKHCFFLESRVKLKQKQGPRCNITKMQLLRQETDWVNASGSLFQLGWSDELKTGGLIVSFFGLNVVKILDLNCVVFPHLIVKFNFLVDWRRRWTGRPIGSTATISIELFWSRAKFTLLDN